MSPSDQPEVEAHRYAKPPEDERYAARAKPEGEEGEGPEVEAHRYAKPPEDERYAARSKAN